MDFSLGLATAGAGSRLRFTGTSELPIPIGDEVRAHDVVDGELVRPAITSNLHAAVLGPADGPGKVAPPLDPRLEPHACALPHKPRKVPLSPQGPIKPGRAHFQQVRVRNVVGHVERRRNVATDALAVVDTDERLVVSIGPARNQPAGR